MHEYWYVYNVFDWTIYKVKKSECELTPDALQFQKTRMASNGSYFSELNSAKFTMIATAREMGFSGKRPIPVVEL